MSLWNGRRVWLISRVQSKDLLETSAQKACSVSPAHFRSALAHSRRLLKSVNLAGLDTSPGRRSSRSQNPVSISTPLESSLGAVGPSTGTADVGPFNTPKKRFKYTSGIDVSSLVRNTPKSIRQHEPVVASPLRHSVTPSKRPISPSEVTPHNEMVDEEDARTPTKRVKFGTRAGVDLEHADVHVPEVLSSLRKRREDPSAFLAMRPGGTPLSANMSNGAGAGNMSGMGKRGIPIEDGLPDIRPVLRREKTGIKEKKREKRDWRYPEQIWGSRSEENKALLETVSSILAIETE